jgi:hypothetical protein
MTTAVMNGNDPDFLLPDQVVNAVELESTHRGATDVSKAYAMEEGVAGKSQHGSIDAFRK